MPDSRPSWQQYFMNITQLVASRSTCPRAACGAIVVANRRILTTGYNGSPAGNVHCTEVGCEMQNEHCIRAIHAEQNAILQSALLGVRLNGATMYCTHRPCHNCAKSIIGAGIRTVVFMYEYDDKHSKEILHCVKFIEDDNPNE